MLARGIRSYHRPTRLEEALKLIAQGGVPLAGGTRLFASAREVPNVLDLSALGLARIENHDGDLTLGATATLQDVIDLPLAYQATAGLLPAACRAHSASRMIRSMATLGGESVHAAHDSDLLAALLALNAVYLVQGGSEGPMEIPAVRFLKNPGKDLGSSGLLMSILIPGAPDGAALERVAVLPSAPSLVSVAVAVSFAGDRIARGRVAVTGVVGPPARVPEAEARLEGTPGDELTLREAASHLTLRLAFRDDAHAPAAYRKRVASTLALRALTRAVAQARAKAAPQVPRLRSSPAARRIAELPYFTSGRLDITVNGKPHAAQIEARTTLLDMLRREGFFGTKHGCESGECGACTVLLDGKPILSCLTLALRAHGRNLQTVEGLGTPDALHPIQSAFVDEGAIQCGYCTPAMELAAKSLLDAIPEPSEAEVREALAGCLCRCTGYVKPVRAVLSAARALRRPE
ncbi:MAG TPA: 2Fe-2S iron-sulfur cluster-binding protein [Vicinamibacteria bacterium]|nr:2Fe-2S iron-sulfur cluster-binding protein [Vicinamibacteria bacterium]